MAETLGVPLMSGAGPAREIMARAGEGAARFEKQTGEKPCLATILVGDDPTSATCVRMKRNRCAQLGIESRHVPLPASTATETLVNAIGALADDPAVHGILL
ncbi:tetrahydrofolate dehydrogenase/cyclohydrolase catalytic domain-containing protein [Saccharopolyspora sp. NPDC050389]|uniref:tetrahydrofolate dehydrogenase/cyclohydrolase catalytic domain-containing protein n=1 Tax=Saccharopolyspora sp. NPDC050389 TaxID=3155516 RepID=UPI0033D912E3